jgi:hypothetical protein
VPADTEIDWKARAQEAERREAQAWEAYHALAADRHDAAHYMRRLSGYKDSLSWKVTAPLRFALALVRHAVATKISLPKMLIALALEGAVLRLNRSSRRR